MKIKVDELISDFEGNPILLKEDSKTEKDKDGNPLKVDKTISFKTAAIRALKHPHEGLEAELAMSQHYLAKAFHFAEEELNLTIDQINLLREAVKKYWTSIVLCPIFEILDKE